MVSEKLIIIIIKIEKKQRIKSKKSHTIIADTISVRINSETLSIPMNTIGIASINSRDYILRKYT
jgi:hypothetical protein